MVCKEATVATTEFLSRRWWQEKSIQRVESRNGPPDPETCLLAQIVKLAHHCSYWGYVSQRRLGLMEFFFFFTNIKWRFPLAVSLPLRSPLKRNHSLWLIICFSSIPLSSLLLWESWYFFVTFQVNDSRSILEAVHSNPKFPHLWTTSSWIAYFPPDRTLGLELNRPTTYTTLYHCPYASQGLQNLSSLTTDRIHDPLQWKQRVLATGLPGKSQNISLKNLNSLVNRNSQGD